VPRRTALHDDIIDQVERQEDALQLVISVGASPDDSEPEVHLRRSRRLQALLAAIAILRDGH
jgi:hypothetical protein